MKPRFSLWTYLLVTFGLSWPFFFAGAFADTLLHKYMLNATAMLMVAAGTYICGRFIFNDGFRHSGWSFGRLWHYPAVIGFAFLLWGIAHLIDILAGFSKLSSLPTAGFVWIFVFLFVTLIPGFGEEFGWRGYLLPHLARTNHPKMAVLIHSLIWWIWHLPMVVPAVVMSVGSEGAYTLVIAVVMTLLLTGVVAVFVGVIYAYIWQRSRSLAVTTVFHAAYDGIRDSFSIAVVATGATLYPVIVYWPSIITVLAGIFLLWKGDWSNLLHLRRIH